MRRAGRSTTRCRRKTRGVGIGAAGVAIAGVWGEKAFGATGVRGACVSYVIGEGIEERGERDGKL